MTETSPSKPEPVDPMKVYVDCLNAGVRDLPPPLTHLAIWGY